LRSPWKEAQITYLKNLQTADLQRRRRIYPETNEMFLAYEVIPVMSDLIAMEKPLILDLGQVHNLPTKQSGSEYVRGELIGFCEITQRPYGLGKGQGALYDNAPALPLRPILTNLAVKRDVRKYGIGSKLLDQCEQHVAKGWKLDEIILEVEDYNTRALDFYANREYELIFEDPASRRFDVGGLLLRKVPCTRKVFKKVLSEVGAGKKDTVTIDLDFFRRIRETVGVSLHHGNNSGLEKTASKISSSESKIPESS
jgi:GNAT superfamily N-acetyltransferase